MILADEPSLPPISIVWTRSGPLLRRLVSLSSRKPYPSGNHSCHYQTPVTVNSMESRTRHLAEAMSTWRSALIWSQRGCPRSPTTRLFISQLSSLRASVDHQCLGDSSLFDPSLFDQFHMSRQVAISLRQGNKLASDLHVQASAAIAGTSDAA